MQNATPEQYIELTSEEIWEHLPQFQVLVEEVEKRLDVQLTLDAALREFVSLFRHPIGEKSTKVIEDVLLQCMPKKGMGKVIHPENMEAEALTQTTRRQMTEKPTSPAPRTALSGLQAFKGWKNLAHRTLSEIERVGETVPRSLATKPTTQEADDPHGVEKNSLPDSGRPPGEEALSQQTQHPQSFSPSSPISPLASKKARTAKPPPKRHSPRSLGGHRSPSSSSMEMSTPPIPNPERHWPLFPRPIPSATVPTNGLSSSTHQDGAQLASPPRCAMAICDSSSPGTPVALDPSLAPLPLVPCPVMPVMVNRLQTAARYWSFTAATPSDDPAWHRVQLCRQMGDMCDILLLELSIEKTLHSGDLYTDEEKEKMEASGELVSIGDDEFLSLLMYGEDM